MVIALFCERTARVKQELTRRPSIWTVHAPPAPDPQPLLYPKSSSRSRSSSRDSVTRGRRRACALSVHLEDDIDHVGRLPGPGGADDAGDAARASGG